MPRISIPLNHCWKYLDRFDDKFLLSDCDESLFTEVTIPHTNVEVPYNYFDETISQIVSCYRNAFELDRAYQGKQIFLDFEGVMAYAEVYLNGELVSSHKGGYTPFSVDVTGKVGFEIPNALVVKVDSRERDDIPPFGGSIDYLTFGGIYREVNIRIVDPVYIENVFIRPQDVLEDEKSLEYSLFLSNASPALHKLSLDVTVKDDERTIAQSTEVAIVEGQSRKEYIFEMHGLTDVTLWDLDLPNLYTFEVTIRSENTELEDSYATRFGFRSAEFTPTGFLLNGRKVKLRGLNRHQTFPYVGQAMPERAQRKDADILKDELHLNLVRTSHYPQSIHFLDRCDEIGLLVLEEIPGWQYIGNEAWKKVACENVREMIQRDWNHPSIISWGVRINESADDRDFYSETNRIAHALDATRQTSGIRCIPNSELLEDIYTMNDFSHCGEELILKDQQEITGLDRLVPYMVTEFNGHMYPTKRFDQEERLIEHALRHARIQSCAGADEQISGAIGWCAFDYNTHQNFGSGDRICYHGVMDMFRLPKFAAQAYRSQVSPDKELVLEPVTLWARGERNIGGVIPMVIFTNCESVELYYGNNRIGNFKPDAANYPGLDYPPVIISLEPDELGEWGHTWEDGRFVGYVGGKPVIEKHFVKDPLPERLHAAVDDESLRADGIDVTRVVFRMEDRAGNLLPYVHDFLTLSIQGPGEIIGPHEIPLIGGTIAVWVKSKMTAGTITLSAVSIRLTANDVTIKTSM